jgi:hypothetical protein
VVHLWDRYRDLGLPKDDFVAELISGKKPSLFQRVWEMMVARHLDAQGHKLTASGADRISGSSTMASRSGVEANAPEPRGLPDHWLTGPPLENFAWVVYGTTRYCCAGRPPSRRKSSQAYQLYSRSVPLR